MDRQDRTGERKPHLDHRSPLVLDIHELDRRAGTLKHVEREVPAPADLGIDMVGVPEGSPMQLDLRLEAVVEGVLVTGTVDVELAAQCTRCLVPIADADQYHLQELYFYPGRDADEDASFIVDDLIDLDPAIRDAIVLELPFAPLCRDDCAGLCVECGANLNEHPDHTHGAAVDARWAGLQALAAEDEAKDSKGSTT